MLIEKAIRILREEGIYIFFKKSFRYFRNKFQFLPYLHFFFKIKKFNSDDINESVDFVFNRLKIMRNKEKGKWGEISRNFPNKINQKGWKK